MVDENTDATSSALETRRRPGSSILLTIAVIALSATGFAWAVRFAERAPTLRLPPATPPSAQAPSFLPPGTYSPFTPGVSPNGDWYTQDIGGIQYLTTETAGSTLTFAFYGTRVTALARNGPEAGLMYVSVDGQPVSGLPTDDEGSYVDLEALQAADELITVADGLRHGQHTITVRNGSGELAVRELHVETAVPMPWAFATLLSTVALITFFSVRALLSRIAGSGSW